MDHEIELSDMKSRFLSIASHEFKTPLTGILSSLNLIDRYIQSDTKSWKGFKDHEKVANHLSKIRESANNLSNILNKFLSLENIEKGEIPVKYTHFDLKKALDERKSQFQQLCRQGQKIHYLHKSNESKVYLDKYLLKNILNNLLSNAIKFSPYSTDIKILSAVTHGEITIEVSDQGMGIPEEEQRKVFRPFYRAANAPSTHEGTGLGLSIVSRYVKLMDGRIDLKSIKDKGTTFIIAFPNKLEHEKDTGN